MSGFESEVRQAPIAPQKAAPSIVSIVGGEWNEWNLKTLAGTRVQVSDEISREKKNHHCLTVEGLSYLQGLSDSRS